MPAKRSRRDDDDEDDDDRPRRRRRDDDDDEDERPRSRRRDDDDEDRPRRRRRDDDDDDRRPARKPRRKSSGPSKGLIIGIVGGVIAIIVVVVLVIVLAGGGANISYAKFKNINSSTTLESLEKDFGKPKKLDRAEWSKIHYAQVEDNAGAGGFGGGDPTATLADLGSFGLEIDAWYHWHSGSEDIYVASGVDRSKKSRLVYKVYTNSNAMKENARAGGDFSKIIPNFEARPVD